ncbi:MAG: hypothetical protein SVU32_05885 [Candidatus Nanohaloarchaea archaeon]|nr:hypothetical protein [Candidatus Nanohaloarchaea archaeon]
MHPRRRDSQDRETQPQREMIEAAGRQPAEPDRTEKKPSSAEKKPVEARQQPQQKQTEAGGGERIENTGPETVERPGTDGTDPDRQDDIESIRKTVNQLADRLERLEDRELVDELRDIELEEELDIFQQSDLDEEHQKRLEQLQQIFEEWDESKVPDKINYLYKKYKDLEDQIEKRPASRDSIQSLRERIKELESRMDAGNGPESHLAERVEQLEEQLAQREEQRDEIIDEVVDRLAGQEGPSPGDIGELRAKVNSLENLKDRVSRLESQKREVEGTATGEADSQGIMELQDEIKALRDSFQQRLDRLEARQEETEKEVDHWEDMVEQRDDQIEQKLAQLEQEISSEIESLRQNMIDRIGQRTAAIQSDFQNLKEDLIEDQIDMQDSIDDTVERMREIDEEVNALQEKVIELSKAVRYALEKES